MCHVEQAGEGGVPEDDAADLQQPPAGHVQLVREHLEKCDVEEGSPGNTCSGNTGSSFFDECADCAECAVPCSTPLKMSPAALGGRSDMRMPTPMPRGLARVNTAVDTRKVELPRSAWARLRPRLKAMSALCTITARKMDSSWAEVSWTPMAIPDKRTIQTGREIDA